MKKGFVVAAVVGVAFAAASPPQHNHPTAIAPAHSVQAPAAQTASKSDPTSGSSSQSHPQVATDQAISLNTTLPSAPQAFGWLIVLACTVALLMAMATVVLTAVALRG